MTIRKLAGAAIVASLALGIAVPASAAGWNNGAQFRQQINQLDRQVDRNRGVSNREERRLDNQVERLEAAYRSYSRGGFTRYEAQNMQRMIDQVRYQFRAQANDRNNRYARNDRNWQHRNHR